MRQLGIRGVYSDRTLTAVATPDVPTTKKDMKALFEWKYGDEVYGDFAQDHVGMKNYRKDIEKSYGKEDDYKAIFIDTLEELNPQLEKWRGKAKKRRK